MKKEPKKETKQHTDTEILDWLESQGSIHIGASGYDDVSYYAGDGWGSVRQVANEVLSGTHYSQNQ